jgi:peptidyl-prolyl cis-trans isomerase SurA
MKLNILFLFIFCSAILNAQEVLDKIVAVVDNEIILKSELDYKVNILAAQKNIDPSTPGLEQSTLNEMIEEKLVLAQAALDSITVSDEDVSQRVDYQISLFIQQFGSRERVEQIYGMSIEKIKRELRDEVRKNLMIQRMQDKKFASVEASRRDVEQFFDTYRDSIGIIPEKVTIAHIYRNPKASSEARQKALDFAKSLLDSLKAGADFAELAKKYSEDPASAKHGGDLGYVKRGVFYPEFESAAFSLEVGQISDVVETPVGFHIIQLLDKRGESIHTRHILIKIKTDEQADIKTIDFLSAVRDSIVKGYGTFADYAKKYSEDKQTSVFGGELGTFYMSQLDKSLVDPVSKLKEGEISFPRRIDYGADNYGYHIIYLEKRIPEHPASLNTDYPEIKKLADQYKKQEKYEAWIKELKQKIYWDERL